MIKIVEGIGISSHMSSMVTRSPPAISNLITFCIFIIFLYIFQYFIFKFLENKYKISMIKKISIYYLQF